jgi:hypothetical protein
VDSEEGLTMLTDQKILDLIQRNCYPTTLRGAQNFARAIEQAATAPLLARIEELEAKLVEGAQAVRWAPSSAYWSNELRRIFGPEAREGIDALEARLREAQAVAEDLRAAEAERKPLTESAIQQIGLDMPSLHHPGWLVEFARAIERAHGIGVKNDSGRR